MKSIFVFVVLLSLILIPFEDKTFEDYSESIADKSFEMIAVPGGTFQMGNPDLKAELDQSPVHTVLVDSFWLGKFEITWELYDAFLNRDKSEETFSAEAKSLGIVDGISGASVPYIDMSFGMGKDGYPATSMTQHAAITFCKWLSAKTGHFYRLPTEAEWEYVCKKGLDADSTLNSQAWYEVNSKEVYHQVGLKQRNRLGIYDLLGNVTEWTMDQYIADYYAKSPKENPWAVPNELYPRSLRGGSYRDAPEACTCTARKSSTARWKRRDPQLPKSKWWHTSAPFVGIRVLRPYKTPATVTIQQFWLEPIDDY